MTEYGQESLWRDTARVNAERARDLAARLERRAKAADEVAARNAYLDCSISRQVSASSTSAAVAAPSLAKLPGASVVAESRSGLIRARRYCLTVDICQHG